MSNKRISARQICDFFGCNGRLTYKIIRLLEEGNFKSIFRVTCPHCKSSTEYNVFNEIQMNYTCKDCNESLSISDVSIYPFLELLVITKGDN
jgi:ribosomal protein S27E